MSEEPQATPETTPPPPQKLWRVIVARSSFVLGLISCFSCVYGIFLGIPAIVLGIIARVGLPRANKSVRSATIAKRGIVLGFIGVTFSVASLLIVWNLPDVRGSNNMAICQNNLKQIGKCLQMYSQSHDGVLPEKLSALYPGYVSDPNVFICPASGNKPGDPTHIDDWMDYTYVPGLRMTQPLANASARACYHFERDATLPGWNELYLDGHVEYRVDWTSPRAKQQREY